MDRDVFARKLRINIDLKNRLFEKYYGCEGFDYDEVLKEYLGYADQIRQYVKDTNYSANLYVSEGNKVLFEGAQAAMLDLDHGTYPFVTSSNPTAGGACTGSGVGPRRMENIVGVVKPIRPASALARSRQNSSTKSANICATQAMNSARLPVVPAAAAGSRRLSSNMQPC